MTVIGRAAVAALALLAGLGTLAGAAALAPSAAAPATAAGWARGPARYARLGSAPAVSPGAVSLGPMSASARIELDVALRPRDPARLASFAAAVSTPGDPEFRRYLRPGAFGPAFGATTATVRATTTALKRLGLRVGSVSRNRLIIKVSSTVEGAERAFDTKLVRYRLGSGSVVFANSSAPRLPEAVVGGIQAVVGLSDLALPHVAGLARSSRPEDRRSARPQAGGAVETGGPLPCA